jgi:peptidoglycan/LPS O-acetylase OafA/YrhL
MRRLVFVDALRGIAASAVVCQHTTLHFWPDSAFWNRISLGSFGVSLFFLCSGFVIPASLDRHNSLVQFWLGRCFRLYPLYWFSICAAVMLGLAGRFPLPRGGENLGQIALQNTTMVHGLVGTPNLIGVYWTLLFEMIFYTVISLLFLLRLHSRSEWLVGGLFVMPILVQVVSPRLFGSPWGPDLRGILITLGLMFAGSAAYKWYSGALGTRAAAALVLIVPLGTLVAVDPEGIALTSTFGAGNQQFITVLSYLAAYAVFALALWRQHLPTALAAIGTISYSLYLTHSLVFTAFPVVGGTMATALLSTATTVLISLVTYYAIERPGMALGKSLTLRYRQWNARFAAWRTTSPGLGQMITRRR